jgi:hypothetical protein
MVALRREGGRCFFDRLIPRIEALPGVVSASLMHLLPFEGASGGIDGRLVAEGPREWTRRRHRYFDTHDADDRPPVLRPLRLPEAEASVDRFAARQE